MRQDGGGSGEGALFGMIGVNATGDGNKNFMGVVSEIGVYCADRSNGVNGIYLEIIDYLFTRFEKVFFKNLSFAKLTEKLFEFPRRNAEETRNR